MKPNDVRGFVHKRILRGVTSFIGSGFSPTAGIAGFLGGTPPSKRRGGAPVGLPPPDRARRRASRPRTIAAVAPIEIAAAGIPQIPTIQTVVTTVKEAVTRRRTRRMGLRQGRCPKGRKRVGTLCVKPSAILPLGEKFITRASGDAVMGQFGAGLTPLVDTVEVRSCLPGMVLGKDGLCYNKTDISNKNREHPRGRRPLGTPGEMAALAKAAAFGRRMETTVKRMQKIGVLKKPSRGRSRPRPAQRQIGPGPSIINVE